MLRMISIWMVLTILRLSSGYAVKPTIKPTIDMTHVVNEDTFAWPTATKFKQKQKHRGLVKKDLPDPEGPASNEYWYESNDFSQSEHVGTHTDAPAHYSKGKWRAGQIPIHRLFGPAVKVDISQKVDKQWKVGNRDVTLSVADLIDWEKKHYRNIPDNSILILHTGHGKHYSNKTRYLGRPEGQTFPDNDTQNMHFPGVSKEAAAWLITNRKIIGLGIDTPSIDPGNSRLYEAHQILYSKNIWGLENLARTDELSPTGYIIYNFVHKIEGGSGGPSRVVAFDSLSLIRKLRDDIFNFI